MREIIQNIFYYDDPKIYIYIFFIYAFLGWCMESFGSIINPNVKKFVNRGFLIGPYCPVYGLGVVLINILLLKYKEDPITVFFMSIFICGGLEYFTGWALEKIFGARWWDYTDRKYNINGRVCLETLIPFGIFGTLTLCVLNPLIVDLFFMLPNMIFDVVSVGLVIIFVIDFIISFVIISGLEKIAFKTNTDNTEQISEIVKDKTEELTQEISEKIEDVAMKKASEIIRYNRKRKIKKLRLKRNKERRLLAKRAEQRKELLDFIEKIRYQSTLLKNKVKDEKERIENMFDEKIKQAKKISKERTDIIKEKLKQKSIWYKRIVDAYPNFELLMKKKLYLDKKELKKNERRVKKENKRNKNKENKQ